MKNKSKPNRNGLLFLMKISLLQVLISSFTLVIGYAMDTNGQEVLDKRVSLKVVNANVKEVLTEIEAKADVSFTYRPSLIKPKRMVTLNSSAAPLRDILAELFDPSAIEYEIIGKQIVLKERAMYIEEFMKGISTRMAIEVTGTIKDDAGAPLPGVNILEKGTTNGTTTDVNGFYRLQVNDANSVLVFSFIGYVTQEVSVGGKTSLDITLQPDVTSLEEVVVVGYGEQKKVTVTGSVVAVGGAELEKSPSVDLSNSFAGRLAGVVAVQTSGEPGNDASTIRIRGVNTIGNTNPLVVIDGIPDREGGFNRLTPQDVESISVLKDASAAIYGSRAANGVILVTTKRGKTGPPKISYDFNQGWSQPTRIPKMSNAVEYATIMNELAIFAGVEDPGEWSAAWQSFAERNSYTTVSGNNTVEAKYSAQAIERHRNGSDPWGYPDTDWFGDALKTWSPQSRHNLQISGGSENVKYFSSLGYVHQDAIYKNSATNYKQYNARINIDAKISEYVSTSFGLLAREEERNYPTQSAGDIFRMLMRGRPTEPEVWPNGLPGPDIENGQNPYVITTSATGYDRNPITYLQSNGKVDITNPWVKGLKLTLQGSLDRTINRVKRWETPWYLYTWDKTSYEADGVTPQLQKALRSTFTDARLTQSTGTRVNTNLTAMISYDKTFLEGHTIGFLAGVTKEEFEAEFVEARRREYISTSIDQPFFGGAVTEVLGGNDNRNTYNRARLGYYGRVNYNYKEKYIAEFLWRVDGSSFFPADSRFGFFPSVSAGWVISSEDFFSNNVNFINYLKLRSSYGQMGNDQIYRPDDDDNPKHLVEYAFLSLYDPGRYPINGQVATTLMEGTVPNPDFTWEVSNNFNIGVDGTLLNDHVDFSFEYFYNKRSNMLIFRQGSTPESSGISTRLPPVNAGRMDNKGYEFTLGYNGEVSGLRYRVGVNAGYNKNEIVYMDEATGAPSYQWQTGHPWEAYLAYVSDGVFRNQEEIDSETLDYTAVTSQLRPGDMKFQDINGDGRINGDDKRRMDKSRTPNFNYGIIMNLEFRNFDLSVLFQGATGALLQFGTESGDIGNFLKYSYDNRWSIENPSSEHPRLADRNNTYYTGGEFSTNTYYLFNKNYLRLKNIELGYTVPVEVSKRAALSHLRIYVNALNLVTWDKYKIFDPEADNSSLQYYPQTRVINTGVRLTF